MPLPGIARAALLEQLAAGLAARVTVVTPNRRLAQALVADVDAMHAAAGRPSWEAPDVLAFGDYVSRCHDEALHAEGGTELPALLSDPASRLLWEEAVRASRWGDHLLSVPSTASMASDAWTLAHAWRIDGALRGGDRSEEAEAFAEWAEHYSKRTARDRLIDEARLPALVAPLFAKGVLEKPASIVLYAFDLVTPQQSDFLDACARAGIAVAQCDSPARTGTVKRTLLEAPRAELEQAARWARARLEAAGDGPAPRIAVVVPDLAQRRREAARVFSRVFSPRGPMPGGTRAPLFNLSLGEALSEYPIIDAALALLDLASGAVAYDRASRLLRSPFIEGCEGELSGRARLDAALRRLAPATLTLTRLRVLASEATTRKGAPACDRFLRLVDRVLEASRESGRAAPHEWARRFTRILDAAGFPGERALDSVEYQTLEKWREALSSLAALGFVSPAWSGQEARSRLQRLCSETVFQPKSGEAPVQVLGLLESPGLAFDHLWVAGLTEDVWPIASKPHPLISPALQRKAGIPQASPELSLEFDRAITEGWKRSAPEVVFSTAARDGDRELLPSPLVAAMAAEAIEVPQFQQLRDALFTIGRTKGAITKAHDDLGPPIGAGAAQGGTGILVDQAACPFRAFAHYRLDARSLERPEPGLGPLERGQLLHAMMAKLWESLEDQRTLVTTDEATLDALIAEAASFAVEEVRDDRPGRLEGRFAELERERLAGIAREWLAIESKRPPFEVGLREEKMTLSAGNLGIRGRIDRVDHLEGGGVAIIDYKSGRVSVASWMGDRPDDAQLPLYALAAADQDVRAVAFARLKTGHLGFMGVARDKAAIPGIDPVEDHRTAKKFVASWAELIAMWRTAVDKLGENFASGDATVDPKDLLQTCERCDLKSLCRVHERLSPLQEGEPFDDPAGEEEGE